MDWTELALILGLTVMITLSVYCGRRLLGSEKMDQIMNWIETIVLFVEQTMPGASGPDKLSAAQTRAVKDLKIDPEQARVMIEACVKKLFNS